MSCKTVLIDRNVDEMRIMVSIEISEMIKIKQKSQFDYNLEVKLKLEKVIRNEGKQHPKYDIKNYVND